MSVQLKMKKIFGAKSDVPANAHRTLSEADMNLPIIGFADTEDLTMKLQKHTARAQLLRHTRRLGIAGATALLIALPTSSPATPLDLSSAPLFLTSAVQPNILFLADDSGSMDWNMMTSETDGQMGLTGRASTTYSYIFPQANNNYATTSSLGRILPSEAAVLATANMPNLAQGAHGVWRSRYSGYNTLYYNPDVTYLPWAGVDAAGVAFANATPTAARLNPYYGNTLPSALYLGSSILTAPSNLVDLTAVMSWTANSVPKTSGSGANTTNINVTNYYPAQYYTWTDSPPLNGVVDASDLHTLVEIKPTPATYPHTAGTRIECGAASTTCTYAQELQNFANWFSYYRRRGLTSKNAIGKVIAPSAAYMGLGTLHDNGTVNTPLSLMNASTSSAGNKRTLLNAVYRNSPDNATPLRTALNAAGRYYECTTNNTFGAAVPAPCPILPLAAGGACQRNFTILMTDGFYNDAYATVGNTNNDGDGNTSYDGGAYADKWFDTLADIAMDFYERDLSPLANSLAPSGVDTAPHQHMVTYAVAFGVDGSLTADPTKSNLPFDWPDPNFEGVSTCGNGTITCNTTTIGLAANASSVNNAYNGMFIRIISGTGSGQTRQITAYNGSTKVATVAPAWPTTPTTSSNYEEAVSLTGGSKVSKSKVDDLRHAAYNGRGQFLSAKDPTQLSTALSTALNNITGGISSASSVAVNSRTLTINTTLYQARFTPGPWSGDLRALSISTSGVINDTTPLWNAGLKLESQNWDAGRNIITYNGTSGVSFRWGSLTAAQQVSLNDDPTTVAIDDDTYGAERLKWLRGDSTKETASPFFRSRSIGGIHFKLGDLANSAPVYVGPPGVLPDSLEPTSAHSAFSTAMAGRARVIYVGGNDGMLHGFDATSGNELLAYVPSMLYPNLNQLTNPAYIHRYYADGSPIAGDVFGSYSGCSTPPCWRTVLVSGLSGGGKGYFALDVTNPSTFTTAEVTNAGKIVLWELSATSDNDLGYTFSQPTITKVKTGATTYKWVAIFGNGYNSVNESAALYVVDIQNGTVLRKIVVDTGGGTSGNGLSTPAVWDENNDYIADYVYAGDLKGNLWKFDLTDIQANWEAAYGTPSPGTVTTPVPLFKAVDGSGASQPITARPAVSKHPTTGLTGAMVYVGTGRYVTNGDKTPASTPTNTLYGIWDKSTASTTVPVARADLLPQTISELSPKYRAITSTALAWRVSGSTACVADGSGQCLGWRVDLPGDLSAVPAPAIFSEMSVANPVLLTKDVVNMPRVIFPTLIPTSGNFCTNGGKGWLMELDPVNGGALSAPFVDTDGVNGITASDGIPGGFSLDIGIISEPAIIFDPANNLIHKPVSGSSGAIKNAMQGDPLPPSTPSTGISPRKSWRQLR